MVLLLLHRTEETGFTQEMKRVEQVDHLFRGRLLILVIVLVVVVEVVAVLEEEAGGGGVVLNFWIMV